ncbi:MAG: hypothetical protein ACREUD_07615 [Gammaproteobacteria bacterium]
MNTFGVFIVLFTSPHSDSFREEGMAQQYSRIAGTMSRPLAVRMCITATSQTAISERRNATHQRPLRPPLGFERGWRIALQHRIDNPVLLDVGGQVESRLFAGLRVSLEQVF